MHRPHQYTAAPLDGPLQRMYEKQVLLRRTERIAMQFRDLEDLDRTVPARDKHIVTTLLCVRP
jgi:hypothetical protein